MTRLVIESVPTLVALTTGLRRFLREQEGLLFWLGLISIFFFVLSLVVLPVVAARIPSDYFLRKRRPVAVARTDRTTLSIGKRVLKNCVGVILLLAGIAMLVLPGQGLLTMLLGLGWLDFPGKFRLERWLVRRPTILLTINWLRRRRGRPPLAAPPGDSGTLRREQN